MKPRLVVSAFACAVAALTSTAAFAAGCTGNVQYSDDFSQANPAWPTGADISIGGGKMQLKQDAGKEDALIYQGAVFTNADICVTATVSPVSDPTGPGLGVIFWQTDWNNYYGVYIAPNGAGAIMRIQNGKALQPVSWRTVPSIKTGAGATNDIRVTLNGNSISAYFNDVLFYTIPGSQPQGGGAVGFDFWSEKAAPNVWTLTNLKVTDPTK